MLKEKRRHRNISLIDLAAQIGMQPKYLEAIENGDIDPPAERIEHILSVIENWRKAGPFTCDSRDFLEFKCLRQKCKITIVELSEITGLSQKEIVAYERGLASLPEAKFQSLLCALEDPVGFSSR